MTAALKSKPDAKRSAKPTPKLTGRPLRMIALENLSLSKLNARKHGGHENLGELTASISALGVLQSILVRPLKDDPTRFEVLAGARRFKAAAKLNAAGDRDLDQLPCIILAPGDDAKALEASLAENIARLPMDEMDQYEAFSALMRKGLNIKQIAADFSISTTIVKRRLAIANLLPEIRKLYRRGDIEPRELRILTLANKDKQRGWLALFKDPDSQEPPFWQLKQWLLGGAEISTSAALFNVEAYDGAIISDLFENESYFADPAKFWNMQNAAITELQADLIAKGWNDAVIIAPDQRFQSWDYQSVTKAQGGNCYLDVDANGTLKVHKGFLTKSDAKKAERKAAGKEDSEETQDHTDQRPELSAPLANYIDLHRHSAVRQGLIGKPTIALRLMLAHIMGGNHLWNVTREDRRAANDKNEVSCNGTKAVDDFNEMVHRFVEDRGIGDICGYFNRSGSQTSTIFAKLLDLSDKDINQLLCLVMAERLAIGTGLVDQLGCMFEIDMADHWQADSEQADDLLELMRDREAINAMMEHVIGKRAAKSYASNTGAQQKQIIKKALTGDGRKQVKGWMPRYFQFPAKTYTKRPRQKSPMNEA